MRMSLVQLEIFLTLALLACSPAQAETLVLSSRFVDSIKNRATITVTLEVDAHPKKPHSISSGGNDGDIHMAGRADEVKLPLVAEIINARLEPKALSLLNSTQNGKNLSVTGAWRIWFEHLGQADQIQGNEVDMPATSNPQHLFEIHPVSSFAGIDLNSLFRDIEGYQAYPAKVAFPFYEKNQATLRQTKTAISINSGEGKFNYTEFVMEVAGTVTDNGSDGVFVLANVYDTADEEEPLTQAVRRMVFLKGTDPANQVTKLSKGDKLHVLGIPRVNLAEVAAQATPEGFSTHLPYEMIIIAILASN